MADAPILYQWSGDAMVPHARFAKRCDADFVIGEVYSLVAHELRSQASHNAYFAAVHRAWENLPEAIAERFPTAERLRKHALIKAGYHDERSIVCASKAEAQRVAAFIRPIDDFAIVVVSEAVVTVYTAKSQSKRAMGGKVFQASKEAVLAVLAEMVGTTADELHRRDAA